MKSKNIILTRKGEKRKMKRFNRIFGILVVLVLLLPSVSIASPSSPFPSADTMARRAAVQVALGNAEADLVIQNVTLLSVYTLNWLHSRDIVISGERIVWVGPTGSWKGIAKKVVSGYGYYAVPGFIESHKHIESTHLTPDREAVLVLPDGNTTTLEASHEFGNVNGEMNVRFWLMAREAGSPFKIFPQLGSAIPPTPFEHTGLGSYYDYDAISRHIAEDLWVSGLGEVMDGPSVVVPDHPGYDRIWQAMQGAQDALRRIEGHMSRTYDLPMINAFVAAGYSSDHSTSQGPEAWDKLNAGVDLQLSGGAGNALGKFKTVISYLKRMGIVDWSHLSLTTDDRSVETTLEIGSMDYNIRTAIEAGMPVEVAYAAASLYPAEHWRYDHLVGSITPGRYADVVLLRDPATVGIYQVYADGKLVAQDGKMVVDIPKVDWPEWATQTMNVGREVVAADFAIPAPVGKTIVTAAILTPFYFAPDFMTAELPVKDGLVQRDIPNGISKFSIVDRYNAQADPVACMFWKDIGPADPDVAIASSVAHDHHNIWVLGSSDEAMALAVNRLAAIGGGWTLVANNEVVDEVAFEVGGLMTAREPEVAAQDMTDFWKQVEKFKWLGIGLAEEDPAYASVAVGRVYSQIFATLTCTPWNWVLVAPWEDCRSGLRNVLTGECHDIVW